MITLQENALITLLPQYHTDRWGSRVLLTDISCIYVQYSQTVKQAAT